MDSNPYQNLAKRLDQLPNGFPPTQEGIELRLLAHLFTPEEAELAAQLRLTLETAVQLSERTGGVPADLQKRLKKMARRGLISAGPTQSGLGFGLMPFVVGIYEMQGPTDRRRAGQSLRTILSPGFWPGLGHGTGGASRRSG